ncbi:hypothetical protein SAMN05421730_101121 [Anaerobium acetethylicum]|uniref:Uncharacterized protein n=1 Tax=Anaerobium acetethylicum TaxID=1619234 RepID=A0A1D3TTX4_9FIRM|nr:hypothetical protein SAMN05421730_101121 [Anaerobium acetethylicum]
METDGGDGQKLAQNRSRLLSGFLFFSMNVHPMRKKFPRDRS